MGAPASSVVSPVAVSQHDIFESFAECERYTKSHVENFAVASLLVDRRLRRHFYSIYAFCRGVDDIGDEGPGDRMAHLDVWEKEVERCYTGTPQRSRFLALQHTISEFRIPRDPFRRLIEANRQDQRVKRYPDFESLLDYCAYSANPVGNLVLQLYGITDDRSKRLADYTCTALQLTNFLQDVTRDYAIGRIYIPQDELRQFGVSESEIAQGRASEGFRRLMRFQVNRTRGLYAQGFQLIETLPRRAKLEFAMFNSGGLAVLDQIERQGMDTLSKRPVTSRAKAIRMTARVAMLGLLGRNPLPIVRIAGETHT